MSFATLTSKGQITLPKLVRTQLNLKTGDRLRFEARPDGTLIARPAIGSAVSLVGILKRKAQKSVSVEDIDRGIDREISRKHRAKK